MALEGNSTVDNALTLEGRTPGLVSNNATEMCLRGLLESKGYKLSPLRANGQTGVDILARRGGETISIEVIGFKKYPPARSKDFYEVFFRAISRIAAGAKHSAIALPRRFQQGLPQRAKQYGESWARIGKTFPELEIWLVDTETKLYSRTKWNEWTYPPNREGRAQKRRAERIAVVTADPQR
jgi:hypothetical protein